MRTAKDMVELKLCPFCGGEAELVKSASGLPIYHIWCKDPDCFAGAVEVKSFKKEPLIAAWNTRAERTCVITPTSFGSGRCSNCGEELTMHEGFDPWGNEYTGNYCIECGAKVQKVVGE